MLRKGKTIADTRAAFQWEIPEFFNIGVDICDKTANTEPDRTAIIDASGDGDAKHLSFGALKALSNQLANALTEVCARGDRIAVLLPQSIETAVAHVAISKMGCIALPLFTLFGPDALQHRLSDSGARAIFTNREGFNKLMDLRESLPDLETIVCVDAAPLGAIGFDEFIRGQSEAFTPCKTRSEDPALLIYTSGTTGNPKGVLHGHRVLLGHLPGVEMSHDFFPQKEDVIWTPADWAWIGGLLDVLMPALHHGVPVVACRFEKFTAQAAFQLMQQNKVRNAFLPPTALKMMRADPNSADWDLSLRSVASGGEPLGKEILEWGKSALGVVINEFYGQTECNMIVSSCALLEDPEPGVMGFAVPGHDVAILNEDMTQLQDIDEIGHIAVRYPDPVMFLRYWNNEEATQDKFTEINGVRWLLTGDKGMCTQSGRIKFLGRDDDVITSSGYRIGPSEIEDCLLTHPAVALAGVVGEPDDVRGSIVAAYVQLAANYDASDALAQEIATHVKTQLAAYEAPRAVYFIEEMPMTTTGKIIRGDLRKLSEARQNGI